MGVLAAGFVVPAARARHGYETKLKFLVTVSGTEKVTRTIEGTWNSGSCRAHATGDGQETLAFATTRAQAVTLDDNGLRRGQYIVRDDWKAPAPMRAQLTRAGSLAVALSNRADAQCASSGVTLSAPTGGCATATAASKKGMETITVFGTTGLGKRNVPAPGRTVPIWLAGFLPSLIASDYQQFPALAKLGPCPSSTTASFFTLGHAWSVANGVSFGGFTNGGQGGGYPIETTGEPKPMLPAHFWTKRAFTVHASYSWTYNVLIHGDGLATVGTEKHSVTWTARFNRAA